MSTAICKCKCGHEFSMKCSIEGGTYEGPGTMDPDIVTELENEGCPKCGSEDFEITEVEHEYFDDDVF
jgi:hypothetical protein